MFVVVLGVQLMHDALAQQPNVEPSPTNDMKAPVVGFVQHGKQVGAGVVHSVSVFASQHPAPGNGFDVAPEKMHPHPAMAGV